MKRFSSILLFTFMLCSTVSITFGQAQSREDMLRELQSKHAELQQLEAQFLAPSTEDQNAHAEFLSQSDTGLIRLMPREIFDSDVYQKTLKTFTMRGGGAYYSFSRLTHEYGFGSDIQLASGHLSVGFAGVSYGMLVNLGDVPLDQLSTEDPRIGFMKTYEPPSQEENARVEKRRFGDKGITVREVSYSRRVAAVVDNTYVLRSIDYRTSDVLIAFRLVRKDGDGSVILAWKLLKKYPVPQLARAN